MSIVVNEGIKKYQTFNNQIGGHVNIKGVTCMVADEDGHLLKYLEDSKRGQTEETFYATVFSDHEFLSLQKFIPKYYGTVEAVKDGNILNYLKIENVVHGLEKPNIIDIKIGKVTHDPFATVDKIKKEYIKYPSQGEIGFRVSGMKVYNSKKKTYDCYSGKLFRSCTCLGLPQEKTLRYLKTFFGYRTNGTIFDDEFDKDVTYDSCKCCRLLRLLAISHLLEHIVDELIHVRKYMETQSRIHFYASSLLIAYDSKKLNTFSSCSEHEDHSFSPSPISNDTLSSHATHICSKNQDRRASGGINEDNHIKSLFNNKITNIDKATQQSMCKNIHVPYSIKMIDFGHTFVDMEFPRSIDKNYLFGVANLLDYIKIVKRET